MELLIIIVLLVIAAETTYLTYITNRKNHIVGQTPMFVDTSVLIDGRIVAVAESGFLTRPLYIPRSVVGELQFLADNADSEKRSRARHGLDVINILQSISKVRVVIFNDGVKAEEGVDNRLLSLAKKHGGAVCTIDYNLNKVAVVEGIEVLNVNDLAKTLRMAYLPGEKTLLELTQKGNGSHQGVGHLADGTMVVVEHANKHIGTAVEVEFIRSLQTAAGKMMFARLTQPAQLASQKPATKSVNVPKQKASRQKPQGRSQALQVAQPADTQQKTTQNRTNSDKPAQTPDAPVRPLRQPRQPRPAQAAATVQKSTQASKPASRGGRNTRRRSPEDSMVELANSQE
ncbi:MAG: hypothetical protein ACO1N2_01930 [Candidatus Saccharimonadota bacterium]